MINLDLNKKSFACTYSWKLGDKYKTDDRKNTKASLNEYTTVLGTFLLSSFPLPFPFSHRMLKTAGDIHTNFIFLLGDHCSAFKYDSLVNIDGLGKGEHHHSLTTKNYISVSFQSVETTLLISLINVRSLVIYVYICFMW